MGNRWTAHFINDMQRLNIRPPDHFPRASDFIRDIVAAVGALIERGLAYVLGRQRVLSRSAPGRPSDVFSQLSRPGRCALAERTRQPSRRPAQGASRSISCSGRRRRRANPPGTSPWGPGRPGWHIECSVMSTQPTSARARPPRGGERPASSLTTSARLPSRSRSPAARRSFAVWLHVGDGRA